MAKSIIFQFDDDLDYQLQAVKAAIELLKGLSRQEDAISGSSGKER